MILVRLDCVLPLDQHAHVGLHELADGIVIHEGGVYGGRDQQHQGQAVLGIRSAREANVGKALIDRLHRRVQDNLLVHAAEHAADQVLFCHSTLAPIRRPYLFTVWMTLQSPVMFLPTVNLILSSVMIIWENTFCGILQ